jgi:hypothetical protein
MNLFSRVTIGLLCIVGSLPITANTIWTDGTFGNAGELPSTAQMIWGDNQPLDAIFGNLADANGAAMFQILITDPFNFSATVMPDPFDTTSQIIPQIFLFDNGGLPIVGGFGAFTGEATLAPWLGPTDPGYYFLMVNSVGRDPIFTVPLPDGTQATQPLFCQDFSFDASSWLPCMGTETQPITGYEGQGIYPGAYAILLTGATAPGDAGAAAPEPGSVFLLLSGTILVLAGKKRPSVAAFVMRVNNRLRDRLRAPAAPSPELQSSICKPSC